MRIVLVTGGAGFIGSHLVEQLLEGGSAVRVLDNLSTGSLVNLHAAAARHSRAGASNRSRLEIMVGDVRDRELIRKAVRGVKYVFHLAGLPASAVPMTGSSEVHAVNVEGTLNLLQGALTEGVWRVVLGSCASVYGSPDTVPVSEDAPLRPTSLFAASKVSAETYCQAFHVRHQLDTVILRYFSVYGPRQRAVAGDSVIPNLIDAIRHRRPCAEYDDRSAEDFTHVDDAVSATLAAARAPRAAGRALNIGTGRMVSIAEVASLLAETLGTTMVAGLPRKTEPSLRQMCAQTTLAAELLDFVPRVSLAAGLASVVQFATGAEDLEDVLSPVGPEN